MKESIGCHELLVCATEAARAAGNHALRNIDRRMETVKTTQHDVKLQLDLECQQKAESVIRSVFAQHAILGEEGGGFNDRPEPLWIIDPIDGTVNFQHGLPVWCSSVAVRVNNKIAAGAVFVPVADECFTATLDGPAMLNGQTIRTSEVNALNKAMVATSVPIGEAENRANLAFLTALAPRTQKVRVMGAAAIDICNVACGRIDGYFEYSIHLWDTAAAALIAQQAGASCEILRRFDDLRYTFLCSNSLIHDELKAALENVGFD